MQKPYDAVIRELELFFDGPSPVDCLAMLYAYCDESGQERKDHFMFIAGFIGNKEQWEKLAIDWKAALGNRKSFHAKACFRRASRARSLFDRLAPIPSNSGLRPLVSGVRVSDYWDLVEGTEIEKRANGYCVALYQLVIEALLENPKEERIEFVFEMQNRYQFFGELALKAITEYPDNRFNTPDGITRLAKWSFVPKGSCMMIQPADYLAFAALQSQRKGAKWEICKPIIESYRYREPISNMLTKEEIRRIYTEMASRGHLKT